jgi:hypothetical protein
VSNYSTNWVQSDPAGPTSAGQWRILIKHTRDRTNGILNYSLLMFQVIAYRVLSRYMEVIWYCLSLISILFMQTRTKILSNVIFIIIISLLMSPLLRSTTHHAGPVQAGRCLRLQMSLDTDQFLCVGIGLPLYEG